MKYTTEQLEALFAERHGSKEVKKLIANARRIGADEAVAIGERRLKQIFDDELSGKSEVYNALMKQIEAYEAVLSEDSERKKRAVYSRRKIAEVGAVQMLKDLLAKSPDTIGLNKLRATGNLDAAYEQVVLKYPEVFSVKEVAEAKARLGIK